MMQMRRAGGLDLMHDGTRAADEDNPEGYWEWEEVKSLQKNPRLIEQAEGKVIKVISALLGPLPPRHRLTSSCVPHLRRPHWTPFLTRTVCGIRLVNLTI